MLLRSLKTIEHRALYGHGGFLDAPKWLMVAAALRPQAGYTGKREASGSIKLISIFLRKFPFHQLFSFFFFLFTIFFSFISFFFFPSHFSLFNGKNPSGSLLFSGMLHAYSSLTMSDRVSVEREKRKSQEKEQRLAAKRNRSDLSIYQRPDRTKRGPRDVRY